MVKQWVPGSGPCEVLDCLTPSLLLDWDTQPPDVKAMVPEFQPHIHYLAAFIEAGRRRGNLMSVSVSYGVVPRSTRSITVLTESQIDKIHW